MPNLNRVILCGHLTRDPELKYSAKGSAICSLGIAINETWKDASGEKKESVSFIDITAFGKTGEAIAQYLKKGRPILLEGKLRTESWTDKTTNQPRYKLGVVLESFQFLGDGNAREGSQTAPRGAAIPSDAHKTSPPLPYVTVLELAAATAVAAPEDDGDDVPFLQIPPARIQFAILGFAGNKLK